MPMNDDQPFRFATSVEVRWRDLDALGHVNNAVYLTYLEQSRVHYLRALGLVSGGVDDIGMIIAKVTCTYHSALSLGEQVTVRVRVAELGNTSFLFVYRVEGEDGRLAATGSTVQVCYDYQAMKPVPVPPRWREIIAAYEPGLEADAESAA